MFPPIAPTDKALDCCERAIVAVAEGRPEEVIVGHDLLGDRTAGKIVDDLRLEGFLPDAS